MVVFVAGKKASQGPTFAAVVGQRDLKDGLLAVATDDDLDGLLVRGEKGTAKSTAVRALADLLPEQRAVADCPYGCPPDRPDEQCEDCRTRSDPPVETRSVPLVTLPLGATRDRVVGTLSVADALDGDHEFDPGLLARANRGILYVDEVNLLDDHLVDVLLDAAASGQNRVERDGVTVTHPAEFTLVGTMNPEEGDLRPQLRDRFALQTEVSACEDLDDRVAIIDQALGESDDEERQTEPDRGPGERLRTARDLLPEVDLAREFREQIAELCRDAGLDGHRGDIATARAARTFAALDGRTTVLESDIERAAEFALPHRLTSRPFEDAPDVDDVLDDHFEDEEGEAEEESADDEESGEEGGDADSDEEAGAGDESVNDGADSEGSEDGSEQQEQRPDDSGESGEDGDDESGERGEQPTPASADSDGERQEAEAGDGEGAAGDDGGEGDPDQPDDPENATPLLPGQSRTAVGDSGAPDVDAPSVDTDGGSASGRASATGTKRGATVRTERAGRDDEVDAAASVRAAASRGSGRVESRDLRKSVRAGDAETLVVFAVDASASMRPAMKAAKGTVLELLKDAYQARDEVAFVTFAGEGADVVLPPTDSVSLAARHLKDLPTGDRTPLPDGLTAACEVLDRADPDAGVVIVVTDGRANTADGSPVAATRTAARTLGEAATRTIVVNAGEAGRAGLLDLVAEETDASVVSLDALTAERVDAVASDQ
ncbi:protporphyrin IX magnesium chelatase [Haloarcula marismortui ATCC 43049]|uniref:Protporphyrin IX magnesium chelatase n=1 Tax=Haloarcula marismortui (strain ATCC 43049 / DSM 3752 / JCM 8966 / VKM B-1809) TaxID=272569 RepID=Q5UYB0_HALMA|nr:VWA domain-containing protein [Haloarcula marismortui]AAV47743.1 protporphyrin IX magnesium chelatase [Haloarcula marismortui ATCC 43049]QCP92427.1 VWA domain-containing protein [Haloarcula marismortui ATCC 43049]